MDFHSGVSWLANWGLPAQVGLAKASEGLVIAQPSSEADKDGRTDCALCQEDRERLQGSRFVG